MQKHLITTGGMIDKVPDFLSGAAVFDGVSRVPALFEQGRIAQDDWTVLDLMQVDSTTITDADRDTIVDACVNAPELRTLITHEVDQMPLTARAIKRELTRRDLAHRTIILTGAIISADSERSDAPVNIGGAVAHLSSVSTGVWVSMNGEAFEADHAVWDVSLKRFRRRTPTEHLEDMR